MKMYKVPAKESSPVTEKDIESVYPGLKEDEPNGVGGWIERVSTPVIMTDAERGMIRLVFIVDEEGLLKDKPVNKRMNYFYPFNPIHGDAYFVGEQDGPEGPDFVALPDTFHEQDIVKLSGIVQRSLKKHGPRENIFWPEVLS